MLALYARILATMSGAEGIYICEISTLSLMGVEGRGNCLCETEIPVISESVVSEPEAEAEAEVKADAD